MNESLAQLPRTSHTHFTLHFFAATYLLLYFLHQSRLNENDNPVEQLLQKHPFLGVYFDEITSTMPQDMTWHSGLCWWKLQIEAWEDGHELPLCALSTELNLTFFDRLMLILCGIVEEDSQFTAIFRELQGVERPTTQLLEQINGLTGQPSGVVRNLISHGLLQPLDYEQLRSTWQLRVPLLLWDLLCEGNLHQSSDAFVFSLGADYPAVADLRFPNPFYEHMQRLPTLLQSEQSQLIVLRGGAGSDRARIAGSLAQALERHVLAFSGSQLTNATFVRQLRPMALLLRALPVITFELGPGEVADLTPLDTFNAPLCILLTMEGGIRGRLSTKAITLTIPPLRYKQRYALWQTALADSVTAAKLATIAERFHLPAGHIRQTAQLAKQQAALEQQVLVSVNHIRHACRTLNHQQLDNFATHIETLGNWDQLVVRASTSKRLHELEQRCRHRERLSEQLAPIFTANHHRGVRALFTGASGTGKTMAARILAAELGMELYRVDLAAIVNKYIGETEKNLHQILSRAEALDVILLFDEGDALFGTRTDVRSANDRYANLETNYLLQRLEHYSGIVVITTNMGDNIDSGFRRRIDIDVSFMPPQSAERKRIWRLHLSNHHTIEPAFIDHVATVCHFTGGQIRNAAIFATLLALDTKEPVNSEQFIRAIQNEYDKAGAVCPLQLTPSRTNGQIASFVNAF